LNINLPVLVQTTHACPRLVVIAVLQFDPFDSNDLFNKILMVLKDADLRKEMISKGQKRLKDFSWQATAGQNC